MSGKSEQLSIRLEPALMAAVNDDAKEKDVSAGHIVRDALREKYPNVGSPKIMDVADMMDAARKQRELMAKRVVVDEEGYIILDGWYEVEMSRCDTHEKILGWVLHLSEKDWADRAFLRHFVAVALSEAGLGHPHV